VQIGFKPGLKVKTKVKPDCRVYYKLQLKLELKQNLSLYPKNMNWLHTGYYCNAESQHIHKLVLTYTVTPSPPVLTAVFQVNLGQLVPPWFSSSSCSARKPGGGVRRHRCFMAECPSCDTNSYVKHYRKQYSKSLSSLFNDAALPTCFRQKPATTIPVINQAAEHDSLYTTWTNTASLPQPYVMDLCAGQQRSVVMAAQPAQICHLNYGR